MYNLEKAAIITAEERIGIMNNSFYIDDMFEYNGKKIKMWSEDRDIMYHFHKYLLERVDISEGRRLKMNDTKDEWVEGPMLNWKVNINTGEVVRRL